MQYNFSFDNNFLSKYHEYLENMTQIILEIKKFVQFKYHK